MGGLTLVKTMRILVVAIPYRQGKMCSITLEEEKNMGEKRLILDIKLKMWC